MKSPKEQPPNWAERFLEWYCKPELVEEILGDLYEMFMVNSAEKGTKSARRQFVWDVLRSFRLSTIKNLKPDLLNFFIQSAMLQNYFKVTFRLFSKNKTYLLINSLGLGVAIACCLAAYLLFAYNVEFDSIHQPDKVANIFKIHAKQENTTGDFSETMSISAPLAPMALEDIAGINRYTRYLSKEGFIQNGGKSFSESIHFADSTFFDLFDFPLKSGNLQSFKDKHSIILTEKMGEKLFGKTDPIGKNLTLHFPNEKELLLTVGGVVEQMPQNNTFVYKAMIRFDHFAEVLDLKTDDWSDWRDPATFFELASADIAPQVSEQLAKYMPIQNEARKDKTVKNYRLEPFLSFFKETDIYGWVRFRMSTEPLIIFGTMAFMILLIACFNLTNTSIAMSNKRLKEIGVRKAIGATRQQIITQFLTETTLTMLIALAVGYTIAKAYLLPEFTAMFNFGFSLADMNGVNLFFSLLIFLFLSALLAGIFPALFNSKMNPVNLVKGSVPLKGTNWFTRSLVAIQFAMSVIFLIGGTIFYQNSLFMDKIDFGYASEEMIAVEISNEKEYNILTSELSKNPKIKHFAGTEGHVSYSTYRSPVKVNDTDFQAMIMSMGKDYLKTIGLDVMIGEEIDLGSQYDPKGNVLVNQAFLDKTGITDPINQQIIVHNEKRQIVGVVANHKERADRAHINEPFVYYLVDPNKYSMLVVNTAPENLADTYYFLQKAWRKNITSKPFMGYYQTDILFKKLQYFNSTLSNVFLFLTFLGTLLSLAGIYAMAALNIAKRTKEIGIRKVLGASVKNIVGLVNREFVIILSVAGVLGGIVGYFLIGTMIEELVPYHVPVGLIPVVLSALVVFIAGFLTTSSTILKVAMDNPVSALKSE